MRTRTRQPYKRKTVSKGGALIFGVGFGALLATMAIVVGLAIPGISTKLENLPYYARTYYRKLMPHPEYLPTPAPAVSVAVVPEQSSAESVDLNPPAMATTEPSSRDVIPAAANIELYQDPLSEVAVNISGGENLLLSQPNNTIALQPVGDQVQLAGMAHQWQTWNNCGPATITTNMSFFGRPETQVEAAQFLKPNSNDKNVSPYELAAYARTTGMGAVVRQNGSVEQIKQFLSNNIPVLAETWLVHDGDGLGHYRLLIGYDDATGHFNTSDSLNGPDYSVSYDQFDTDWRVFNRLYVIVFPQDQADIVSSIIGENIDDTVMYESLAATARAEIDANPNDAVAYFNLGQAITRLGRYEEAVIAFDQARILGLHWRRVWYQFTPFEAYYAVGRYQDVLDLTQATIKSAGGLEEAYYYQGLSLHATGQQGAEQAFQNAIAYNANFTPAHEALRILTEGQ